MRKQKKIPPARTTLLIHCSVEEAEAIRAAAKADRRTISNYIVIASMIQIEGRRQLEERQSSRHSELTRLPANALPVAPRRGSPVPASEEN